MLNVALTESWCRAYQVLPRRTHPLNNVSGAPGFLLSATKVSSALPPNPPLDVKGGVEVKVAVDVVDVVDVVEKEDQQQSSVSAADPSSDPMAVGQ